VSLIDRFYAKSTPKPEPVSKANGCRVCGKMDYLPFVCPYCGNEYCADHKVPEQHACPYDKKRPLSGYDRYAERVAQNREYQDALRLSENEKNVRYYSVPNTMEHVSSDSRRDARQEPSANDEERGVLAWLKRLLGGGKR